MITYCDKRCVIGEGPIWNSTEKRMYFTNGIESEICIFDIYGGGLTIRQVDSGCAAFCFDSENRLIVSRSDGVFILNPDGSLLPIYDRDKYRIELANDMKVGPDGRIYVGTQSGKRAGVSDKIDGKLYSIDINGNVKVLLDGLRLSNGLDWSKDGRYFYHTDSDLGIIREYKFSAKGDISFTGREVKLRGVDGFCCAENGDIYATVWGGGYVAVIDGESLKLKERIDVPAKIPVSCAFVGEEYECLAVTTATMGAEKNDVNAGMTFILDVGVKGKPPYIFGKREMP